jgi:predicted metal-dependent hydrolase
VSPPSSFKQLVQQALQLDFFSDVLGNVLGANLGDNLGEKTLRDTSTSPNLPIHPHVPLTPGEITGSSRKPISETNYSIRKVLLQEQLITYELHRSKRRTIGFLISENGLRITAPRWVTLLQIEEAIFDKQNWILNKLSEKRQQIAQKSASTLTWENGTNIPFLGRNLTLRLHILDKPKATVFLDEYDGLHLEIHSVTSAIQIKARVLNWLQLEAIKLFTLRLNHYAAILEVRYLSLALSSANTRWGSCTSQGKIRLNWRLIHFPLDLIDYVVAHELAHIKEMNHSPRFWMHVASIYPDYELAMKEIKVQAKNIPTL